ncbi:transposase [Candidatus Enterovibrio altilux]|uniref:transposase n=1 Tax=Candidatus Enterovibrio altilux TaxID=1927128 RepID=UPI001CC25967
MDLLKGLSFIKLLHEFNYIVGALSQNIFWNRSYFAGTCGDASLNLIKQYIQ